MGGTVDPVGASSRIEPASKVDASSDCRASEAVAGGTPARSSLRPAATALGVGTAGTVIASFLYLVYGYVFSNGLCCGDDAFIAVAAKNLAQGRGYATSLSATAGNGLHLFDPALSTGPTLVLPAAAIIKVFGATPWAPGLATALVTTALLTMIAFVLGHWVGPVRTLGYIAVMLTLMYTVTAGSRFTNWYSLLGEVPAAMLTILGVALFVWRPGKRRTVAWAFLALGLAFMTKALALLSVVPVTIWLLVPLARSKGRNARQWTDLAVGAAAFSLPFLLFETWKLSSLGVDAYLANWHDFIVFLVNSGSGHTGSVWDRVVTNSAVLQSEYGFGPIALLLVIIALAAIVHTYADHKIRTFCWLLLTCGATYIAWFIFSSAGNPRYAMIGVLLLAASAACVAVARPPGLAISAAVAVVAIAVVPAHSRVLVPVDAVRNGDMFRPTQRVVNLKTTADFLTKVQHKDPFVGDWWATVADLEYALPTVSNFVSVQEVRPAEMHNGRLLARNTIWTQLATSPLFTTWEATCKKVLLSAPPYLVTQCPQSGTSDQQHKGTSPLVAK